MLVAEPDNSTASRFISTIVMINTNRHGQIKFKTSCTDCLEAENESITFGAVHSFYTHRGQDVSSMYLSHVQANQAGPEGEWETGNRKFQSQGRSLLFPSPSCGLLWDPLPVLTTRGLPSPSKSFVVSWNIYFHNSPTFAITGKTQVGGGGQGTGSKIHLNYKVIRSSLVKCITFLLRLISHWTTIFHGFLHCLSTSSSAPCELFHSPRKKPEWLVTTTKTAYPGKILGDTEEMKCKRYINIMFPTIDI